MQNLTIIGVDNGYGNTKTAHHCFPTAVVHHGEKAPAFKNDLLHYQGQYYTIGTGHKTFTASKVEDEDTYLLTLAALAMELKTRGLQSAKVFLAVGLPLTWVTTQKAAFDAIPKEGNDIKVTPSRGGTENSQDADIQEYHGSINFARSKSRQKTGFRWFSAQKFPVENEAG